MAAAPDTQLPEDRHLEHGRIAHELRVQRFFQPDDVTCGPTCLRKVYDFYGIQVDAEQVLGEIDRNDDGGTLAVFLGIAALRRGFRARIYSYDLQIFDPTWARLPPTRLAEKIHARFPYLRDSKRLRAARAYLDFLERGGEICLGRELTPGLLKEILDREHPVLAGLSATYLYHYARERWDPETGARGRRRGRRLHRALHRGRATSTGGGASSTATSEHVPWQDGRRGGSRSG
jgi:hypothetical protein